MLVTAVVVTLSLRAQQSSSEGRVAVMRSTSVSSAASSSSSSSISLVSNASFALSAGETEKNTQKSAFGYKGVTCLSAKSGLTMDDVNSVYKESFQQRHIEETAVEVNGKKCVQHQSVAFTPPILLTAKAKVEEVCSVEDLLSIKGWRMDDAGRFSHSRCTLNRHTRNDIAKSLHGKRIIFTGDSIIRQMYLRLIDVLRNDRPLLEDSIEVVEHYYHTDSYYAANSTSDALLLSQGIPAPLPVRKPLFELLFVWDPFPLKYVKHPYALKPTHIIAGFMYWWKPKDPFTYTDGYFNHMTSFLEEAARNGRGVKYYFLTTPWSEKGTFGGVDDARRIPRNEFVAKRVKEMRNAVGGGGGGGGGGSGARSTVHLLDFAAFADLKHFPKTADHLHYQCIFRPGVPKEIKVKESKLKPSCTDPINYNWANLLVSLVAAEGR